MSEQDAALSPEELFDKIVQLTDVPKMLGGGIVKRCLRDAGFAVETATTETYMQSLSHFEKRLRLYHPGEEKEKISKIRGFLLLQNYKPSQ